MILNEHETQMTRELARELVRAEREQEIERMRLAKIRQQQSLNESMESLGRGIRVVRDSIIEGYVNPILKIRESIIKGYNQ